VTDATDGRTGGSGHDFGTRLQTVMRSRSGLCVGIDPHVATLASWGLSRDEAGLTEFGRVLVEAAAGRAGVVKPQIAFFEAAGVAGFRALQTTIDRAQDAGLLVVADVKRGDIGTTGDGYAEAWIARGDGFHADAMTVSPYLGYGSLASTIRTAQEQGAGVFVLAATSNPEGRTVQTATVADGPRSGRTVAAGIVLDVADDNRRAGVGDDGLGSVGLVLGATLALDDFGITAGDVGRAPILAPGFGAQGARIEDLRAIYGPLADQVVVNESRGLLVDGPDGVAGLVADRAERIRAALA
jgi:orotidine-5'-phosphate decarboxylase